MRLLDRLREREITLTHTPGDWCEPGRLYLRRDGDPLYRITRVVPLSRTRLITGGSAACYSVRGVPVSAHE